MSEIMDETLFFPLSAISHYSFCPRRCALVHIECAWSENYLTISGKRLHARVDVGGHESRGDRRFVRSLRLYSRELGVCGIADVVEFCREDKKGVAVPGWRGKWMPYPIEYKFGTAKNVLPYKRQLCAQAICLEELFQVRIQKGMLYLGTARHRQPVTLDDVLRNDTKFVCGAIREMLDGGNIPLAKKSSKCKACSLANNCMPKLGRRSVKAWLAREIDAVHKT